MLTAILPRRTAHDFLKSFGEGTGGFVAERPCDFGDAIAGIRDSVRGETLAQLLTRVDQAIRESAQRTSLGVDFVSVDVFGERFVALVVSPPPPNL
jgi:hypothetical protein